MEVPTQFLGIAASRRDSLTSHQSLPGNEVEEQFVDWHTAQKLAGERAKARQLFIDRGEPVPRSHWLPEKEITQLNFEISAAQTELAQLNKDFAAAEQAVGVAAREIAGAENQLAAMNSRSEIIEYNELTTAIEQCDTRARLAARNESLLGNFMGATGLKL